jgi:hypothetical protein
MAARHRYDEMYNDGMCVCGKPFGHKLSWVDITLSNFDAFGNAGRYPKGIRPAVIVGRSAANDYAYRMSVR